jgi:hypothetical protein
VQPHTVSPYHTHTISDADFCAVHAAGGNFALAAKEFKIAGGFALLSGIVSAKKTRDFFNLTQFS